jgi:hypothetical protein
VAEKGDGVTAKDVFDRMHMRDDPGGKEYVDEKAAERAVS